jgi:transaldolase
MKIFIDSADIDEIKQAYDWGIADGVTTNPSLLKKAVDKRKKFNQKLNLKQYIRDILKIAKSTPVSLEVTKTDYQGMLKQAKSLYRIFNPVAKNVYIKIPINPAFKESDPTQFDGIRVIKKLTKAKIPTNCTLIFTPEQALLAAKAGASFVSPFAGRIDDFIRTKNKIKVDKTAYYPARGLTKGQKLLHDNGIHSGIDLVWQTKLILSNYHFSTKVLAASLRNIRQVRECAKSGADIATLPFSVIKQMLKHEKTYQGMASFTKDIVPAYEKLTK